VKFLKVFSININKQMFTNVSSIEEIQESNEVGFLYIFDALQYDNDISITLDDVIKLGMTTLNIKKRLIQYKIFPKNISYINCNEPSKRERLLKSYIKEKLSINPVCGSEYFRGCRKELEKVILYFALCDLDDINKYYDLYDTIDKINWFNSLNLDEEFILKKNNIYSCDFCDIKFSLKRTLATHLKTSKRCISKRPNIDIRCIWCNGTFITKEEIDKHYKKCEADKNILYIKLIEENKTKDIILKEKDKEIERLSNIIKALTSKI
jgi:hypothetical protein